MLDFSPLRVVVLGDVMLDRFLYGDAGRLSPEAPVPVVRRRRTDSMPGGAANVGRNLLALDGQAAVIGLIGEDAEGQELTALVGRCAHLVGSARRTSSKLRVIAAQQQVVRVDDENTAPATEEERAALLRTLGMVLPGAGALVLSDYGKGVLTPGVAADAIAMARQAGVPCLVDPKGRDYSHYAGADALTPNARELAEATGMPVASDAECEAAARRLLAQVRVGAILVTRSERGMMLVPRDAPAQSVPAQAQEVFDVSGAGDTAIATLALAVASGRPLGAAMRLSNAAAGVVVSKLGTATCSAAELELALRRQEGSAGGLINWAQARALTQEWQRRGLRVGFANGCFDLLHAGHVRMLQAARTHCDRLVVALNDDASVSRLKGPTRPLNTLEDRAVVIGALSAVDAVIGFAEDTPLEAILALRPDRLFKGQDYTIDQVVGAPEVAGWGGETVLLELLPGRSTTALVQKAKS
ncbi:D-glycero-beta-D-manno-heptose-7-phosphate kinase [Rhodovarius crocodyli]|uniref:Bifunctional protein HldE n=1 Tax=Rhodovarius crocodyli TaxID=1979269 RepID=A0A437MCH2_9PROT|nr:D-glycero-beta-D-manno-heptose-7-phosphate kinase [Rhodovarius crocodyli]RVT95340.1 D-glycero-beta-D-manno-heptose-7-phosphate kinase [Rhodovarius crocodyli]